MKYAKKMKLVEIDNDDISTHTNNSRINDEEYAKPHVLSPLDNIMNKILKTPFISDGEKWRQYSQALQRYLNHVKITSRKIDYNSSYTENREKDDYNSISSIADPFNFSIPSHDISGLYPIRDSLDSISQPVVKSFFERARSNTDGTVQEPLENVDQPSLPKESQPAKEKTRKSLYYTRSKCVSSKKRRAEESLSAELSQVRPCKIVLNKWLPSTAR